MGVDINNQVLKNTPTVVVVFGATGNLAGKKILPAIFHLSDKKQLPKKFKVVGFSREDFSEQKFQKYIEKVFLRHKDFNKSQCKKCAGMFSYEKGLFQNKKDYDGLIKSLKQIDDKWGVCSNKLFYLSTAPEFYEDILKNLASSGLTKPCSLKEGWTRVIVEKPFGKDLKTAKKLDALLEKLFKEIQIYRIDHYLAKEMLRNILTFRFSNNLFEHFWSNKFIESVHIKLLEKDGVEKRGDFYDKVGALRDVGQNHLLQTLALIAMDYPKDFNPNNVRNERAKVLENLKIPLLAEIKNYTFRAQHQGYKDIDGVSSNSKTETYFKIRAFLNSKKWQEVPFIMESGKKMGKTLKEIVVTFKHSQPCLFCISGKEHYKNRLIFRLEPDPGISIDFWTKKPGLKMAIQKKEFKFNYSQGEEKIQYVEEYEKLLLDCILGDQTLFISCREINAMWKFIDPIIAYWEKNVVPLKIYKSGTDDLF